MVLFGALITFFMPFIGAKNWYRCVQALPVSNTRSGASAPGAHPYCLHASVLRMKSRLMCIMGQSSLADNGELCCRGEKHTVVD